MSDTLTAPLPEHLGGHAGMTNIDLGVFEAICVKYKPASFLDIGCGPGGMLRIAQDRGLKAKGIDGDWTLDFSGLDVLVHDFTSGHPPLSEEYDLGWCVEFLEHVEEKYLENIAPTFQACRYLWVTHALPGQVGWHHVNCRSAQYWRKVFERWGFAIEKQNERYRMRSTMKGKYSRRTGMLLMRK